MMPRCKSTPVRALTLGWLMGLSLLFSFGRLDAQSLRDPTLAPVEAGLLSTAPGAKSLTAEPGAMAVIVRDGRPFLVVGTRLYAAGQKMGQARIERISETEVWLREGGVLRKVSQFPGIQRRTVTAEAATPACAAKRPHGPQGAKAAKDARVLYASRSSKTSSPVVPCADVQP